MSSALERFPPVLAKRDHRKLLRVLWRSKLFYLMLLPGLAYYVIFQYGPMYGTLIAFKEYQVLEGILKSPWANPWYRHFQFFFQSPYFVQLLSNSILISLYKLLWGMPFGIALALALNEVRNDPFRRFVQTVTYMPHFLSWVIIYGIVMAFFSESFGLVNSWLRQRTGASVPFLTSTVWFRSVLVASDVWKDAGWGAIIYLASMAGIDPCLYEAARIDGATRLKMIWHITLPSISSVIIVLLILRMGYILDAGFEQVYVMYNVYVYPVADIIDTWVYRTGLQQWSFSLASAVGLFKSAVSLALVLSVNRLSKLSGESLW